MSATYVKSFFSIALIQLYLQKHNTVLNPWIPWSRICSYPGNLRVNPGQRCFTPHFDLCRESRSGWNTLKSIRNTRWYLIIKDHIYTTLADLMWTIFEFWIDIYSQTLKQVRICSRGNENVNCWEQLFENNLKVSDFHICSVFVSIGRICFMCVKCWASLKPLNPNCACVNLLMLTHTDGNKHQDYLFSQSNFTVTSCSDFHVCWTNLDLQSHSLMQTPGSNI